MGRVVVVGSSNTDLTLWCPRLPGRGETVLGSHLYEAGGGKGANQAVAAARAGAQVVMVCAVGDDDFGRASLERLKADGIDTTHVAVKRGVASGVALILVEEKTGENLIGVASGANAELRPQDVKRAASAIAAADVLLLQLEVPIPTVAAAARVARQAGVAVVLNPAPFPAKPLPKTLFKNVDYLVPNAVELAQLAESGDRMPREKGVRHPDVNSPLKEGSSQWHTRPRVCKEPQPRAAGPHLQRAVQVSDTIFPDQRSRPSPDSADQAAARLFRMGVKALVVTLGAKGARVVTPEGVSDVPASPAKAVDTVGAGDCFCGYLAAGLAERMTLTAAAALACAAAAISVTRRGAQPSMPARAEVR